MIDALLILHLTVWLRFAVALSFCLCLLEYKKVNSKIIDFTS
jgi:hypothetical protein